MIKECSRKTLLLLWLLTAQALAREVPITVLHTCDLHGHILPAEDYEGHTNMGGLARCATVIQQVRRQEKNVLLVDAGDTIQGGAESFLSDGHVMMKAMNHLRYDAWVWGNHEFDWGLEKLAACADKAAMPILNANVKAATPQLASRLKPFMIVEVDGVKVGVIGLNTPGIPTWSRPRLIGSLELLDSVETLRAVMPAVKKGGAEVVVLVCHQGYREAGDDHANQIGAIARNFPELDVIIAGHTHRNFPEYKISNILYCQAGYYGIHLGRVNLTYDTTAKKLTRRESQTLLMDDRVRLDDNVLKLCKAETARAEAALAVVLGEATGAFGLDGAPRKETPIHNLICASISEALSDRGIKVDAVIHGILDRRATLPQGPITAGHVWRVMPYENTIGIARLTPVELQEVLDENAGAYHTVSFRGIWGLKCAFDPDAPEGDRVRSLTRPDGQSLAPDQRVVVAFNSFDLASGGLRWSKLRRIVERPQSQLVEYDLQTRQAVCDFIRRNKQITPITQGWWRIEKGAKSAADPH